MARPSSSQQKPMVGWYAPSQLAKTGVEVAISTIFGRHSDHRLVEAMASGDDVPGDYAPGDDAARDAASGEGPKPFYDYSHYHLDDGKILKRDLAHKRDSIWIDYVGDVGDGWNSTYAVAHYLADPAGLTLRYTERDTGEKKSAKTERGDILIFGGDEVYPTASRQEYNDRLVAPYETALRNSPKACPHVFAVPGNHDWYDSLVAFTRLFTARPWFGGWRTRQSRSYFALKLPHNWWLLGTDLQLGSDIDKPQMEYFESLAAEMDEQTKKSNEPARVIVCHAEPHWIRAAQYGGEDPNYSESNLKLLEKRLGTNVAVFMAGDLHHYRRHESEDKSTQKITAGGGGAFLHPTHIGVLGKSLDEIAEVGLGNEQRKFKLEGCFPSTRDSRRACWRNLIFPYLKGNRSRTFGLLTALLYLLLTLPVVFNIDDLAKREPSFGQVTYTLIQSLINSPVSVALILALIIGFVFFTDTHSNLYRWIMGGLHGAAHVLAACAIALFTVFLIAQLTTPEEWTFRIPWPGGFYFSFDMRLLLAAVVIFGLGFVVGSFIMGAYLLLSLNFFGRHGNEAFSSLGIEDFKNFIRLHINENGDLTIYPIGIRRVPRKWKPRESGTGPELVSDDPNATDPELIELPIVMRAANTETGVFTTSPDTPIESTTQSSRPTAS
jgi:hypothetical protein